MKSKKKSKETGSLLDEQQQIVKRIGARIKELRLGKGHSSYEVFYFENEIDRSQYGKCERGPDMRISSLVKVLCALDFSIEEFFREGFSE
jgi:hypothetical protein